MEEEVYFAIVGRTLIMIYLIDLHIHTYNSYDSVITLEKLLQRLRFLSVECSKFFRDDFALVLGLVDHNRYPDLSFRSILDNYEGDLCIFLGSEILTKSGEIMVLDDPESLVLRKKLKELIMGPKEYMYIAEWARKHGLITILPHPFIRHKSPEVLAKFTDFIEIFNGRSPFDLNIKATRFCLDNAFLFSAGSDAHFPSEIFTSFMVIYTKEYYDASGLGISDLRRLLVDNVFNTKLMYKISFKANETFSQLIAAVRRKEIIRSLYAISSLIRALKNFTIVRRIMKQNLSASSRFIFQKFGKTMYATLHI